MAKRKIVRTEQVSIPSSEVDGRVQTAREDSAAGRYVKRTYAKYLPPPSPTKQAALNDAGDSDELLLPTAADVEEYLAGDTAEETPLDSQEARRRKTFATLEHDSTLRLWSQQVGKYLDEILRLEGLRGHSANLCPTCAPLRNNTANIRCSDCYGGELICAECCVEMHARNPFHRVKRWNGQYFEKTTLQALGFILHVGHPGGGKCPAPDVGPQGCLVLHTNGFHPVTVHFCGCSKVGEAGDRAQQLLRCELYGATITDPTTFCTLRLLEHFHGLTLQSKLTAYDFYMSLERMSDITGLEKHYDRLKPFLRVVREWRYLKMLKRGGRGHIADGTKNIPPGDLALRCPACPRPGFNLPDNWDTVSDDMRFLYVLIVAIDANFRLKRRAVSNDARDPALGSGLGFFVEDSAYRDHVLKYADQEDISTCTGFAAMAHANTKYNRGYAATGVGLALCARHGFILPNGVGDLQKGERYCNMDYIVMSALRSFGPVALLMFSYDIACQWAINLPRRLADADFPSHLRVELPHGNDLRYVIPKYHFWGHKGENHNQYSLNFVKGSSRTDGEEVERNWWRHDATAASTREMGPGSRHDTLEDHFQFSNFIKLVTLDVAIKKRIKTAREGLVLHDRLFKEFTDDMNPEDIEKWTAQVIAWERDPSEEDPYFVAPSGLTESQIRVQLAEEEEKRAASGSPSLHNVTPLNMLVEMLEIEELQRRFYQSFPNAPVGAPTLALDIIDKRATIRRRLQALREVQAIYMPCVPQLVAASMSDASFWSGRSFKPSRVPVVSPSASAAQSSPDASARSRPRTTAAMRADPGDQPERQPLFFPHQLDSSERSGCIVGLDEVELRLRDGQLRNSLDKLRVQLHIKHRLLTFKARNSRGQRQNMKSREQIESNETKIISLANKYRAARVAKVRLSGPGPWEEIWRPLAPGDVRRLQEEQVAEAYRDEGEVEAVDRPAVSEGQRQLSWIWMRTVRGSGDLSGTGGGAEEEAGSMPGMSDALRGEWLRSRARATRYREEIATLSEEQRRVFVSLEKNAARWDVLGSEGAKRTDDSVLADGIRAYACEQASILRGLVAKFRFVWYGSAAGVANLLHDEGEERNDGDEAVRFANAADDSDGECRNEGDGVNSDDE